MPQPPIGRGITIHTGGVNHMSIRNIRKRDGREVVFDQQKIEQAIFAAFKASGSAKGHETSAMLAQQVVTQMENDEAISGVPTVEQVQDTVERVLIEKGFVREVISKLQTMRKEAGFEVTDRIEVKYTCKEKLANAIASGLDMIKNGTLALSVEAGEDDDTYTAQEWKINDQKAVIAVRVSK